MPHDLKMPALPPMTNLEALPKRKKKPTWNCRVSGISLKMCNKYTVRAPKKNQKVIGSVMEISTDYKFAEQSFCGCAGQTDLTEFLRKVTNKLQRQ
jgi:hypothetical protein